MHDVPDPQGERRQLTLVGFACWFLSVISFVCGTCVAPTGTCGEIESRFFLIVSMGVVGSGASFVGRGSDFGAGFGSPQSV